MNYAWKYLTRQKIYEHKYLIHVYYLGEYVFKSIILEPVAHIEYLG
jgi:hypothetical protein